MLGYKLKKLCMSLKSIKPVRFTLPLPGENRAEFINIVGGSLRKGG